MTRLRWVFVPTVWGLTVLAGACGGTNPSDILGPGSTVDAGADDGSAASDSNANTADGSTADGASKNDGGGADASDGGGCAPAGTEICGDGKDNDCNGQIDDGCNGKGTFVSGAIGDDNNPGTQALPLKTIAKGMANAKSIGTPRTVYVAGGHYPENVDLQQGISLSGGYLCKTAPCPWTRDPVANDTAILNQRAQGLVADVSITSSTSVDGFRIQGMNGSGGGTVETHAVSCNSGSPTLTNNVINAGTVPSGSNLSVGLYIGAATNDQSKGVLVDSNVINGADVTSANSYAVALARNVGSNPSVATITRNQIRGGDTLLSGFTGALALAGSGTNTLVSDNTFTAGTASSTARTWAIRAFAAATIDRNRVNTDTANVGSCATVSLAFCGGGIEVNGTSIVITNNVVFGVKGNMTTAIRLSNPEGTSAGNVVVNGNYLDGAGRGFGAASTISAALALRIGGGTDAVVGKVRNNILLGGLNENRFGVYEEHVFGKTCHPEAFDHNDVFFPTLVGATDVVYHADDGSAGTGSDLTLAQLEASSLTTPSPSNNLTDDCLIGAGFHLGASSPCANAGTATEAPAKDFEGEIRPKGAAIDIGADEAN